MTETYYSDAGMTLYHGDVLSELKQLPDESVQCVVTSPPYFGLRDYGTATWVGGDDACDHKPPVVPRAERPNSGASNIGKGGAYNDQQDAGAKAYRDICGKCGAQRVDKQLGLEPTPDEYVANMVAVFAEVRRVLRSDGTCWLNLGDSYAGSWGNYGGQNRGNGGQREITNGSKAHQKSYDGLENWRPPTSSPPGLKPKDLVGIPWRVAFALQADGWWLRSDIIWAKPNPMPESVTDRPTKAHEYLFLLTKSSRYAYDADAIAEESNYPVGGSHSDQPQGAFNDKGAIPGSGQRSFRAIRDTRNKRSVWTVSTHAYNGAHFAVFPPKLIEPCILAGSKPGDVVLDPFMGSGTTALVAQKHGRKAIGIDISATYLDLAIKRNAQKTLWFTEAAS